MRPLLALLTATLIAQPSLAQPLAPGQPAGVIHARMSAGQEALMIGTGVAIMTAVGIVVGGGSGAGITTGPSFPVQQPVSTAATS